MARPTRAAVVVAVWSCVLWTAPVRGATTFVSTVEISSLAHTFVPANPPTTPNAMARDGVTFPSGPGTFSGPGFTASIGPTDEVVVRFQSPAGQRFVVNVPPATQSRVFAVEARWLTGVGDTGSQFVQGTVTWIGLEGPAPTQTFAQDGMFDNGQALKVNHQFSVTTSFAFEAIEIRFPVVPAIADVSRTHNAVTSIVSPSFVASASGPLLTDSVVMELQNVPTLRSWNTCTGSWSSSSSWSGSMVPQPWDMVDFSASPGCTKVVNLAGSPTIAGCEIRSTDAVFQNGTLDVAGPGAGLTVGAAGSNSSLTVATGVTLNANAIQVGSPGGTFGLLTLQGSSLTTGSLAMYRRQGGTGAGGVPIRVQSGSQLATGHPVIGQQDAGIDVQGGGAWWCQGDVSLTGTDGGGLASLIGTNGDVQIEGTLSLDWGKVKVTSAASVFELGALNLGYAGWV